MRVTALPASSSHSARSLAAVLALWLAGTSAADADEITASAVHDFAAQKIDGMARTSASDSSAALVGAGLSLKTGIDGTFAASPTGVPHDAGVAHDDGRDVLRSFIAGTVPLQAVENLLGGESPGRSPSAGEWILRHLDATAPGVAGGCDLANPQTTIFLAGRYVAWRDGRVTPNPDAYPVWRSKSGNIPSDRTANGHQACAAPLFSPIGRPGTPSIDLVAEAILDGDGIGTLASGASDQATTGGFGTGRYVGARAADSRDFDLVERLVVHSWDPGIDIATASNAFALDIGDATGRSVFGPFLGANPSVTRMLSIATASP